MNENDKKEFALVLTTIAEIYELKGGFSKTKALIYFSALQAHSIEQVKDAVNKHVADPKHGSFMPKPADLIRHIDGTSGATLPPSERFRQKMRARGFRADF
ncbi:hypothetical protein PODOV084v1_p0028 [Vibrio phage 340E47.2]|nr:hypothetical protein PODOV084v1_p0028 [Vibrio phage 340E47.2]QZI91933.1 hypothetical protein PODOV077v1_p0022 [Vibrio phage 5P1a]